MLYCIYHRFPLNGRSFNIGKDELFVQKMVTAYLKGENTTTISGENYSVGSESFQIFKVPVRFKSSVEINRMFSDVYSNNVTEALLSRLFENVTDLFLQGRERGDLKENYYNIYINDGAKKPIIIVLTKTEVLDFLSSFSEGTNPIWIGGRLIHFSQPKAIKVFDIYFEYLSKDRATIKAKLKKWVNETSGGKWNIKVLENFGKEVTTDFVIKLPKQQLPRNVDEKEAAAKSPVFINENKIFISHSSKDLSIVSSFVNNILKLGFDIKSEDIFCTSIEGGKILTGDDFRKVIAQELKSSKVIIQIISENYKRSEVCLNEMGAAWALEKIVIPLIVPPLQHDIGFINQTSQQLQIGNADNLIKLYDDFKENIFSKKISIANLNECIRKFIIDLETDLSRQMANENDTDIFYNEEIELIGQLNVGIFSGPPWGEDDPEKQSFHRYYYLTVDNPVNVLSSHIVTDSFENANKFNVNEIQLIFIDDELYSKYKKKVGKKVKVVGELFGAYTGWHIKSVLMKCKSIIFLERT